MSVEVRGKLGESVISFHHAGSRSNLGYQAFSHWAISPVSQGTFLPWGKNCHLLVSFIFLLCWHFMYTNLGMSSVTLLSIIIFTFGRSLTVSPRLAWSLCSSAQAYWMLELDTCCHAQFSCFVSEAVLLIGFPMKKLMHDHFMTNYIDCT